MDARIYALAHKYKMEPGLENIACSFCGSSFIRNTGEFQHKTGYADRRTTHCSKKCAKNKRGWYLEQGYIFISRPRCCELHKGRRRVYDHTAKAEHALGRLLKPNEVVHHINGDRSDNSKSNLLICTKSYHFALHGKMSFLYQREKFKRNHDYEPDLGTYFRAMRPN